MAIVAACAAGGKQAAMHSPAPAETTAAGSPGGEPPLPGKEDPRAEIDRRFAEIEEKRKSLDIQSYAAAPGPATPMASVPLSTDASCKPAKNDKCTQSCTFSDSICDNAKRICDLAASMEGDKWAADKCSSAKQTCDTAHENCCSCQ